MRMWEILVGRHDPPRRLIEHGVAEPSDTRTPRLTLRKLHQLKLLRAVQRLERLKHLDLIAVMYGDAKQDADDIDIEKARLDLVKKRLDVEGKALDVRRKKTMLPPAAT